jgi:protease IV
MRPRTLVMVTLCVSMLLALCGAPVMAAPATKTKSKAAATKPAAKPAIAVFTLRGPIVESAANEDFQLFGPTSQSLKDLLSRMKQAGDDANVKAVVLFSEDVMVGFGQMEEIRQAVANLQSKGKEVYAHSDSMRYPEYILLSAATRLSVVPTADIWVTGLHAETLHLRGLLDKLGVKPDFLTCGDYKSAAEIFMRTEPSPQADEMMNWLLDGLFQSSVDHIAKSRKVDADKAKKWVDEGPYTASKAKEAGLIDAVESRQELDKMLKEKYGADIRFERNYGKKQQPQIDFTNPFAGFQILAEMFGGGAKRKPSTKPVVGIVYVDGPIMLGRGEASPFGGSGAHSSDVRKALDEAARDDQIKAVVLRVDSPGGSAVASEIILDATKRVKEKKPIIVSMGDVAGSGGYYVSCGADTIFADETTITGSIGVVSGKLVTTDMWNKIGVNWKPYNRGANAGMLASNANFTEPERKRLQDWMNEIYGVFKQHVTDIRGKKLKKPIDEIAGGRVYTGKQALELGLVDKIGSFNDAVAFASEQAKLSDYDVRVVPEQKNFLERLMESASGDEESPAYIRLGGTASLVELAKPYLIGLDAHRVRAVIQALEKLQLLEQDNVLCVMPNVPVQN